MNVDNGTKMRIIAAMMRHEKEKAKVSEPDIRSILEEMIKDGKVRSEKSLTVHAR